MQIRWFFAFSIHNFWTILTIFDDSSELSYPTMLIDGSLFNHVDAKVSRLLANLRLKY